MKTNPYVMTEWHDHIVDPITGEVIEEGTRFTAGRANNIEEGIFNAYGWIMTYYEEIQKLRVQLDMVGRAPVNNGTFFDTVDGDPKALVRDMDKATAQSAISAGATTISVNATPFAAGEYVVVYDDASQEIAQVTAVGSGSVTVSALANAYKKGANVARTNAKEAPAGDRLIVGDWGTYSITAQEVV